MFLLYPNIIIRKNKDKKMYGKRARDMDE